MTPNLLDTPQFPTRASDSHRLLRVMLYCTGVGIENRGVESFFRECFDGLHPSARDYGLEIKLFKGAGPDVLPDEKRVWCVSRRSPLAPILGAMIRRNTYVVEQLTFVPGLIRHIRKWKPDVIFYSDCNVAMRLEKYRKYIGVPYRLLYSNGGPLHPPFDGVEHVQQLAPNYYDEAIEAGEPKTRHTMLPLGFNVPDGDPLTDPAAKRALRERLNLPIDRPIVLSVGWVSAEHKRMDHTIGEIAQLPSPRPYLVMLGSMNENTPPILKLADEKLGKENYTAKSVPYEAVGDYYRSADIFMLSSLVEAFGRVYVEAMIHGLPTVVHDNPTTDYIIGDSGRLVDLSRPGPGAAALLDLLAQTADPADAAARRNRVRAKFSWPALRQGYADMFRNAAAVPLP